MTVAHAGTGSGKVRIDAQAAGSFTLIPTLAASSAGEAIFAPFSFNGNGATWSVSAPTSNVGGTWGIILGSQSLDFNKAGLIYCLNAPAGVTSITATLTGANAPLYGVASADRFTHSGLTLDTGSTPGGGSISAVNAVASNVTPLNSGNLTLSAVAANGGILLFAYATDDSSAGVVTIGGSGTWISTHNENDTSAHHAGAGGYQIISAVGPNNVTGLYDNETSRGAILLAGFSETGGAPSAVSVALIKSQRQRIQSYLRFKEMICQASIPLPSLRKLLLQQ